MSPEASDTKRPGGGRVGRFALRYWVAIVLVILPAIFVTQNRSRIPVDVLWFRVTSPLWLLLTVIFVVGVVTGLLLGRRRR